MVNSGFPGSDVRTDARGWVMVVQGVGSGGMKVGGGGGVRTGDSEAGQGEEGGREAGLEWQTW